MTTLIIDGSHLAYRCKYVYYLEHNEVDVSVTYGFIAVLISEIKLLKPSSVIVVWDGGIQAFRKQLLPNYKKGRHTKDTKEDRENFIRQLRLLEEVFHLFGVLSVRIPEYEADDVIYTISRMLRDECIIYSGDADLLQCVTEDGRVSVYNPNKKLSITQTNFEKVTGVKLEHYVDYRVLLGDSSDNITGVKGIGHSYAVSLLNTFGSLSNALRATKQDNWPLKAVVLSKLLAVKEGYLAKVKRVIRLGYDHKLAQQIYPSLVCWNAYNYIKVKKFLLSNAFISLTDKVYAAFNSLKQPLIKELETTQYKLYISY